MKVVRCFSGNKLAKNRDSTKNARPGVLSEYRPVLDSYEISSTREFSTSQLKQRVTVTSYGVISYTVPPP